MRIVSILISLVLLVEAALADTVVPLRTIRPAEVISAEDLQVRSVNTSGAFADPANVIGQEARVALYPGRPIRFNDIGPPALVERNQIIDIYFARGGLVITTEGRALARGGIGDRIRVMNLASRTTLFGFIQGDGTVKVSDR